MTRLQVDDEDLQDEPLQIRSVQGSGVTERGEGTRVRDVTLHPREEMREKFIGKISPYFFVFVLVLNLV